MGDTFNMSGDFRGAILNIKSTLTTTTQTVDTMPNTSLEVREELQQLLTQLKNSLAQVPADRIADAEAVAESAKILVDAANKDQRNKTMVTITAEGLKKAADNIAAVAPVVLPVVTQIISLIQGLPG